jgi:hypothetical protein
MKISPNLSVPNPISLLVTPHSKVTVEAPEELRTFSGDGGGAELADGGRVHVTGLTIQGQTLCFQVKAFRQGEV